MLLSFSEAMRRLFWTEGRSQRRRIPISCFALQRLIFTGNWRSRSSTTGSIATAMKSWNSSLQLKSSARHAYQGCRSAFDYQMHPGIARARASWAARCAIKIIDSDIRTLFMKLSNLLERAALPDKTSRYFRQFSELRGELYSSPQTHLPVEKIASRVNLSKSYFQHIYKELFGCSVVSDMINGRLEYAKYLLQNSSLSIAAISKMCGYENDTHFMRQFKRFVGVTPSQFRSRR